MNLIPIAILFLCFSQFCLLLACLGLAYIIREILNR